MLKDLRYGVRTLMRTPGFTFFAVLALAAGIAANCVVFAVADAVLFRPLPYPEPDRLVDLREFQISVGARNLVSMPNFREWQRRSRSFASMGAGGQRSYVLTGAGLPENCRGSAAFSSLFTTLGVKPALGRLFLPEEEYLGRNRVALISHDLWRSRFGADTNVLGRSIRLDGNLHTIVGVLPPRFRFWYPKGFDIWTPLAWDDPASNSAEMRGLTVIGRLLPGVTQAQAEAEMRSFPLEQGWKIELRSHQNVWLGSQRSSLLLLLGAVAFVLLIACANVANMLLARASGRVREISIRSALGASRMRVARQLFTEALVLAAAGGAIGVLAAAWLLEAVRKIVPASVPRADEIAFDGRALAFTLAVSFATALVFGIIPALRYSRAPKAERPSRRLRNALVVAELALGLVLLSGAGLMINSFVRLLTVNPGFNPDHVLKIQLRIPREAYRTEAQQAYFWTEILRRVREIPGVARAGFSQTVPMGNTSHSSVEVGGRTHAVLTSTVLGDYFETMRIPLLAGRTFSRHDHETAPKAVVINETAARSFWPGQSAIGQRLKFQKDEYTVVGIVGDTRQRGLKVEPDAQIYEHVPQNGTRWGELVVRSRDGDLFALVPAIRAHLQALDPERAADEIVSMQELLEKNLAQSRFMSVLLGIFGALSLVLAATGIYGVISYSVRQRTSEIGVRMAIGASASQVLRGVLAEGAALALAGIIFGAAASVGVTRLLRKFLFEVKPADPATLAAVALLLGAVAVAAAVIPARRASRIDPLSALRYE